MANVVIETMDRPTYRRTYRTRNASINGNWSVWLFDGHNSFLTSEWLKKDWVRTPGYRQLKSERKLLPDNGLYHGYHHWYCGELTQTQNFFNYSKNELVHVTQYRMSTDDYVVVGPQGEDGPFNNPEENAAIADLQSNVSACAGSLAVSTAEIHKTLKLVGDTAIKLVKAKKALFTGRFGLFCETLGLAKSRKTKAYGRKFSKEMREAKKMGRESGSYSSQLDDFLAQTWLEFTYGWKPLIKDVYDQVENLSTTLTRNEGEVFSAVGKAKAQRSGERVFQDSDYAKITKFYTWTSRTRFKVRYSLADLGYRNVFGLNNPALVAWEIVPFSFVVDWFLPIGQFIEGLTAYDGVRFHRGTRTQIGRWEGYGTGVAKPNRIPAGSEYWILEFNTGNFGQCTSVGKTRTVLTEWPHQGFPEVFKNASSLSHATSALALLHTAFKGNRGSTARYR